VRTLDIAVDTETAFTALFGAVSHAFWLDSAGLTRFSHLGADTGPRGELVTYRVGDGQVTVESAGRVRQVPGTAFDYLDAQLATRRVAASTDLPFDPACGYVGYFGYELKADCGSRNKHEVRGRRTVARPRSRALRGLPAVSRPPGGLLRTGTLPARRP
jgi:para-aminobenzoate synthetase